MYQTTTSPYNPKIPSYLLTQTQNQTLKTLKRYYTDHSNINKNYQNLNHEIYQAQIENSKLEHKNIEIQQQYMNKIKKNKNLIQNLNSEIQQIQNQINKNTFKSASNQCENNQTITKIKNKKNKIIKIEQQTQNIQNQIFSFQNQIKILTQNLKQNHSKYQNHQINNQQSSLLLNQHLQNYKKLQQQTKNEQAQNISLKKQLSLLKNRKIQNHKKTESSDTQIKTFKIKLQTCEIESQQLSNRCRQLQKQSTKLYSQAATLKQNIGLSLVKNKEHTVKLKNLENILKENLNGLDTKNKTKQKLSIDYSNAMKDISKVQSMIKKINLEIEDQDKNNKELIKNIKKSILSDEEAVKALTRKVAIITLLSQS